MSTLSSAFCAAGFNPSCSVGSAVANAASSAVKAGATAAVGSAVSGTIGQLEAAIQQAVKFVVVNTLTWWVQVPSTPMSQEPAVARIQGFLLPLAILVACIGVIVGGIRMTLSHKASPLFDLGRGLGVLVLTVALGVAVPDALLSWGDSFTTFVLQKATGGNFAANMTADLTFVAFAAKAPFLVILGGFLALCASILEAVLMIFREGALIVLTGAIVVAASGQFMAVTRPWFAKVTGWMLALIFYKPLAALVYAAAFAIIGTSQNLTTTLVGFTMLIMAIVALPVLMKLFNWTVGSLTGGGGGGLGGAAVGALGATGAVMGAAGGMTAIQHASYMEQHGPGSGARTGAASPPGGSGAASFATAGAPGPAGASLTSNTSGAPGATSASGAAPSTATGAAGSAGTSGGSGATGTSSSAGATGAASAAGPAGATAAAAAQAAAAAAQAAKRKPGGAIGEGSPA